MLENCIGIVLAGGKSSRMGQDKALLQHKHADMLSFSKQLLTDLGLKQVFVSGDNHGVPDLVKEAGPIGGIYSVLQKSSCHAALILPIDLPLMTSKALAKLKQIGEMSSSACYFEQHSLPLYLPINGYTDLFFKNAFKNFSGKGPSIRQLLAQIPHKAISPENAQWLSNTNTPNEWQTAQQILRSGS